MRREGTTVYVSDEDAAPCATSPARSAWACPRCARPWAWARARGTTRCCGRASSRATGWSSPRRAGRTGDLGRAFGDRAALDRFVTGDLEALIGELLSRGVPLAAALVLVRRVARRGDGWGRRPAVATSRTPWIAASKAAAARAASSRMRRLDLRAPLTRTAPGRWAGQSCSLTGRLSDPVPERPRAQGRVRGHRGRRRPVRGRRRSTPRARPRRSGRGVRAAGSRGHRRNGHPGRGATE